jgi:hypothetical protein
VQVNPERWRQRAAATPAWDTLKGLVFDSNGVKLINPIALVMQLFQRS